MNHSPKPYWLVVWTPLKKISQLGWLFPIYGKKMFQTTNQLIRHHPEDELLQAIGPSKNRGRKGGETGYPKGPGKHEAARWKGDLQYCKFLWNLVHLHFGLIRLISFLEGFSHEASTNLGHAKAMPEPGSETWYLLVSSQLAKLKETFLTANDVQRLWIANFGNPQFHPSEKGHFTP